MKKFILISFFLFTLFAVNNLAMAEETETTNATSTTPIPILNISSEDLDPTTIIYNSEDKNKLFGCFDVFASSSKNILLTKLTFLSKDSFSSSFMNKNIEKNIYNIKIILPDKKEIFPDIVNDLKNREKNIIFNNLDLEIQNMETKKICIYADISSGIIDEVASKIDLIITESLAIDPENKNLITINGNGEGKYIKLNAQIKKPDLIISNMRVSQGISQNNMVSGAKTFISITYKNIGTGDISENFLKNINFDPSESFEFLNEGKPISGIGSFESSPGIISPSEEFMEMYEGIFTKSGKIKISLEIDPTDNINEINDMNNHYETEAQIDSELDYPDFTVEDIIVEPKRPKAREQVKISVVYKNLGSDFARDLNEFLTSIYFGHIEGYFIFNDNMPMTTNRPLPSEKNPWLTDETYIQTYYGHFNRPRKVTLEAQIDPPNKVIELSEDNNEFSKTIEIIDQNSKNLSEKLKGKIILRVEENGEAYYINPANKSIHSLGRPEEAFTVMREQGVGIADQNLSQIPIGLKNLEGNDSDQDGLPDNFEDVIGTDKNKKDTDGDGYNDRTEIEQGYDPRLNNGAKKITNYNFTGKQLGKIFLQVEQNGEAWYINPDDEKRYFLGRPADAFRVMRDLGLGISESNFEDL